MRRHSFQQILRWCASLWLLVLMSAPAWAGEYGTVGDVPLDGSNYDFFGRTFFVNVTKAF